MAEKFAIYAGNPMADALVGYETSRSARINRICADWSQLIADSVPKLTEAQWCAIIDAANGTMLDDEHTLRLLWAEIADAREICEKWNIDHDATVAAVRGLSVSQLIALRETVRRYWLAIEKPERVSHRAALLAAGAQLSD